MTRIAVLSDIHGNLPALEAVVADAERRGCDGFANLGDILSGPLWPFETADYLMAREWPTIAGNHERQVLTLPVECMNHSDRFARSQCNSSQLEWLASLPAEMHLGSAWCTHARPNNDHEYLLETVNADGVRPATDEELAVRLEGCDEMLILHGHSHLQRERQLPDGRRVANPGSVGLPAYDDDTPYFHRMESGSPDARYLILDGTDIAFQSVAYDFEAAARQAERNGSPFWAKCLREGLAR